MNQNQPDTEKKAMPSDKDAARDAKTQAPKSDEGKRADRASTDIEDTIPPEVQGRQDRNDKGEFTTKH